MLLDADFALEVKTQSLDCDEDRLVAVLCAGSFTSFRMGVLWDTAEDCVAELCTEYPDSVGAVTRLWTAAEAFNVWATSHSAKNLPQVAPVKPPLDTGVELRRSGPLPTPCRQADKRRKLGRVVTVDDTRSFQERKQLTAIIIFIWELVLSFGNLCTLGKDHLAMTAGVQDMNRQLFVETHEEGSISSLRSVKTHWLKWLQWARDLHCSPFEPPAAMVALWLRGLRARGSSVPNAAWGALRWLEDNIGASLCARHPTVVKQSLVSVVHELQQATPLPVIAWMFLEHCLASSNKFIVWLSAFWWILLLGVLRFAHAQRSYIVKLSDVGIIGWCALGKSKKAGRRRPFYWGAARFTPRGTDLGMILLSLLKEVGDGLALWLLYDFGPARRSLANVQHILQRKMAMSRFDRFSRQLWQQAPLSWTPVQTLDASSYSARRGLPSIVRPWGMSPGERVEVGGWLDSEATDMQKRSAMADRYSEDKVSKSIHLKMEVVLAVRRVLQSLQAPLLPLLDMPWDEMVRLFPKRCTTQADLDAARGIAVCAPEGVSVGLPLPLSGALGPVNSGNEPSESSSDSGVSKGDDVSSSASSSVSSDSADDSAGDADYDIHWQLSAGRKGHLHLVHDDDDLGTQVTRCGRCLSRPEEGHGLSRAAATGAPWSPRCFRKLPTRAQRALAKGDDLDCVSDKILAATDPVGTVDGACVRANEELDDAAGAGIPVEKATCEHTSGEPGPTLPLVPAYKRTFGTWFQERVQASALLASASEGDFDRDHAAGYGSDDS